MFGVVRKIAGQRAGGIFYASDESIPFETSSFSAVLSVSICVYPWLKYGSAVPQVQLLLLPGWARRALACAKRARSSGRRIAVAAPSR